jgi:RecJ-like exonuclease
MKKLCFMCGKEFETNKSRIINCPECRKNQAAYKHFYNTLKSARQRICPICGTTFTDVKYYLCEFCRTPEQKAIRATERRKGKISFCQICGATIYGTKQFCDICRKKEQKGTIQKLTLDITLFFTVRCGYTIKHAAAEQQLSPEVLRAYMNTMKDTEQYKRLTEYYREEKKRRQVA